jgi:hypothetical protein
MAEEVEADDLLRIMVTELRKFIRTARTRGQQIWRLLNGQQRRRAAIERGLNQDRWGPDRRQDNDGPDRTAQLERDAARAEQQVRDLDAQRRDLEARNENLREQNEAADQQRRDADAELNKDENRNGRDDAEDLRDQDGDRVPDSTELAHQEAQDNQAANDEAEADRRRDAEREQADAERREQAEQDRRQRDRDEGVDPLTAGAAAGGAAIAADEIDDQLDEQAAEDVQQEQQEQQDLDAETDPRDAANEADNQQQAQTDTGQDGVDPYVAEEGALDPNDRLQEDNLAQEGQRQDSGLDADNALDDPSTEADNVRQTDTAAEQDGVDPYVAEEGALDSPTIGGDDRQQETAGQDSLGATNVVEWDNEQHGDHLELNADQEWDGTVYQTGENGPSLTVHGGQDGQQTEQDAEVPEQSGSQSGEAVNIDRVDGQTFTVNQGGVQFADQAEQAPQAEGPDTQQLAKASQTAVDETAGLGQDDQDGRSPGGQSEGRQTSEAQGTQWRPPEQAVEDPAIADAKAGQQNGRPSGPGQELPSHEKEQFDKIRTDQKPLTSVSAESIGAGAGERSGRDLQRAQETGRGRGNEGRGNDGGRER